MYNFGSIPFFASNNNLIEKNPSGIPSCIYKPSLFGDAVVGSQLSVINGEWNGRPDNWRYSWYRGDELISQFPEYLLTEDDLGEYIKCVVTAFNNVGNASASTRSALITAE